MNPTVTAAIPYNIDLTDLKLRYCLQYGSNPKMVKNPGKNIHISANIAIGKPPIKAPI